MTDADLLKLANSGGDCTAELQARIAAQPGGEVRLPNASAVYKTTGTLTLPNGISLSGPSGQTIIDYGGPADKPAIRIDRNWGYRLSGITVRRSGENKTGVGIEVIPDPSSNTPPLGTCSGNAVWDQVGVFGFATGAQLGSRTEHYSTSELTFLQCQFCNNDTGVRLSSFDTLNLVCINLGISGNRVGLDADTGGRVTVTGGTASNNTDQDFRVIHAHGFAATGFRSEGANSFFHGPGVSAPSGVTITQCSVHQRADAPEAAIIVSGGGRCGIYQSAIGGRIEFWSNGGGGGITIEDCMILADRPISVVTNANTPPCRVAIRGCSQVDAGNTFVKRFADWAGLYGSGSAGAWNVVSDPFKA